MEMGDLMNASLKALLNEQYKLVAELREENKKLKDDLLHYIRREEDYREENKKLKEELDRMTERACDYKGEITELKMENKKLKNYINLIEGTVRFKDV